MTTVVVALNAAAAFVVALAAAYFFLAAGLGVKEIRREELTLDFQSHIGFGHPFAGPDNWWNRERADWGIYFLIPCLDEAQVIGNTVAALVDPAGHSRIVVIDDGSADNTDPVATLAGGDQVRVVTRRLPDARLGKGAALNAGYEYIRSDVTRRGLDPSHVLICVMDADGRLSDGAIRQVVTLFDDERVGGAQLAVRIRNRRDNFWLQFQDHQFWTLSSLTQFGRIRTGTVSLGGNGQFTRMSAMMDLGARPWSTSLTEDLDLAISLSCRGWRLTSTPRAAVDQQGVPNLRLLIRQRARWYQGHMMAGRRLPQVLRSATVANAAAVEVSLYLLVPWLLDLPWSILYHVVLAEIGIRMAGSGYLSGAATSVATSILVWYVLAFWPAIVTTFMARLRDNSMTWRRAIKLGHAFLVTNYLSYICVWIALYRVIRGRHQWAKTPRTAEEPSFPEIPQSPLTPTDGLAKGIDDPRSLAISVPS